MLVFLPPINVLNESSVKAAKAACLTAVADVAEPELGAERATVLTLITPIETAVPPIVVFPEAPGVPWTIICVDPPDASVPLAKRSILPAAMFVSSHALTREPRAFAEPAAPAPSEITVALAGSPLPLIVPVIDVPLAS